jgi:hypothetical protein
LKVVLERNLDLLQQGALQCPPNADLPVFLLSAGKVGSLPQAEKRATLGEFFTDYQEHRPPSKEGNTNYTENIHIAHLLRLMGGENGSRRHRCCQAASLHFDPPPREESPGRTHQPRDGEVGNWDAVEQVE